MVNTNIQIGVKKYVADRILNDDSAERIMK